MQRSTKRYWLFQACGWGSLLLMYTFFNWSFNRLRTPDDRFNFFANMSVFLFVGIALTHIMRLLIIRLEILNQSIKRQIIQLFIITFIFSILTHIAELFLLKTLNIFSQEKMMEMNEQGILLIILRNSITIFCYYLIWSSIYFMYHYIAKSTRQQMDTLKLEAMVKELELKTIKAHINPHFIFNALNGIRSLVEENPGRAREAITQLSNILRSSLKADKTETVPLQKELEIVKDFLALELMRFEDRLKIVYDIDPATLNHPIPHMMLQNLVENAIKHGISKQVSGGEIRIVAGYNNGNFELVVQNSGNMNNRVLKSDVFTPQTFFSEQESSRGFGLYSTTNRLNLLFGNKATLGIKQLSPGIVEAKIIIPA